MFKTFRQLSGALADMVSTMDRVEQTLQEIRSSYDVHGPLLERLETLERAREGWEAQMEAELLRVQSAFKAARNAEERTRTMAANAEALSSSDESEDDGGAASRAAYLEFLRSNGEGGGPGEVPTVPAAVALSPKTRALQAKFGTVI